MMVDGLHQKETATQSISDRQTQSWRKNRQGDREIKMEAKSVTIATIPSPALFFFCLIPNCCRNIKKSPSVLVVLFVSFLYKDRQTHHSLLQPNGAVSFGLVTQWSVGSRSGRTCRQLDYILKKNFNSKHSIHLRSSQQCEQNPFFLFKISDWQPLRSVYRNLFRARVHTYKITLKYFSS